jgi:hypothetical protein
VPADSIVTVVPVTVQTAGVVLPKTTGLVDAPAVAEIANVPPGENVGAAGVATKPVMACAPRPMATSSVTCGAAA